MRFASLLGGGAPRYVKYQVAATNTVVGVPYLFPTLSDTDGVRLASTTAAANQVGVSVDAPGTRLTAQQTDNSDPARRVTLCVNPHATWLARLSGGATAGTALTAQSNTAASTDGLTITTTANNSAYDDGYAWGATGANAGVLRKITAVTTTSTPIIAFPADLAVGDTFYFCTFGPDMGAGVQLTTTLEEVDATGDNQAGDNFRCIAFYHKDQAGKGATESYCELVSFDHMLGGTPT